MFFWNSLAFSMIQQMLAIWSLVPLPFLKPAWTVLYIWLLQAQYLIQYPILGYWFTMLRSSQPHIWLAANIFNDFLTSCFSTMPHLKKWKEDRYTTFLENFLHIESYYKIKFIRDSISSVMAEDKWIKVSFTEKIMNLVIHREAG